MLVAASANAVTVICLAAQRIGTAVATVAVIFGQLAMSMLIDNFGWLGNAATAFSPSRLAAGRFASPSRCLSSRFSNTCQAYCLWLTEGNMKLGFACKSLDEERKQRFPFRSTTRTRFASLARLNLTNLAGLLGGASVRQS